MNISAELRQLFGRAKRVVVLTGDRRGFLEELTPNPAHYEIARWQERFAELTLVTQNIDGLHQKAGSRAFEFV